MKVFYIVAIAFSGCATSFMLAQKPQKPSHSWDVLMDQPEARNAAKRLVGHCGDAETQDVMNSCFYIEFLNSDHAMNSAYAVLMKKLDPDMQKRVRDAQLAWVRYRDLQCSAVGALWEGGSIQPTQVYACKSGLTSDRVKEIKTAYQTP
jgi:uncharacterized protein YecT (DUF1311 family)